MLRLDRNVGFAGGCNAGAAATLGSAAVLPEPRRGAVAGVPGRAARGRGCACRAGARGRRSSRCRAARRSTRAAARCTGSASAGRAGTASASPTRASDRRGRLRLRRRAGRAAGGVGRRRRLRRATYFMYGEDLDLSLRLRLAGWERRRGGRRGGRARLRVREGRAEVVPARAQPLADGARRVPGGVALARCCPRCSRPSARSSSSAARGGWLGAKVRALAGGPARAARGAAAPRARCRRRRRWRERVRRRTDRGPRLAVPRAASPRSARWRSAQAAYWRLVCAALP